MRKLVLFGEKVALHNLPEVVETTLELPENRSISFNIGEVLAVADGVYRDGTKKTMWVSNGDYVMYMLDGENGPTTRNAKIKLNGELVHVIHQGDCIARLHGQKITLNEFEILGEYLLLKAFQNEPSGLIIQPKQYAPPEEFRFIVEQTGQGIKLPLKKGMEVFPEYGKCGPLTIDRETYVFTHADWIRAAWLPTIETETEDTVPSPQD